MSMSDQQSQMPVVEHASEPYAETVPVTAESPTQVQAPYAVQLFFGLLSAWFALPGAVWLFFTLRLGSNVPSPGPHVALSLVLIALGGTIWGRRVKCGRGFGLGAWIGLVSFVLALVKFVTVLQ